MVERKKYIELINPFINTPVIKVITGVRRCGKSTLLHQIIELLIRKKIKKENIIYINKELIEFDFINDYRALHKYVTDKSKSVNGIIYLFIDEIQEVEKWEKAVASFNAEKKFDIFITGSNAHLLSSELATLLTGRYVEFMMYPFSFSEFINLYSKSSEKKNTDFHFYNYLKFGGFPGLFPFNGNETAIRQYLTSLYSTILLKDIVIRYNVRDAEMLENIIRFIISNPGNITSANKISDFVKSQYRKVSVETVQNYINYACNALLMIKTRRFDIIGKRLLESHEKYFICDTGFSFATIGYSEELLSGLLENIVLIELLSRGYKVNIGKMPDSEIDFIAENKSERIYLQVTKTLIDEKTANREYKALNSVSDHYSKIVLSLDHGYETNRMGIRWMNLQEFLVKKENF